MRRIGALAVLPLALAGPLGLSAQVREDAEPLPTDSTELRELAEELQLQFESYRQTKLPAPIGWGSGGGCDLIIGRICKRHGKDRPSIPGEEPVDLSLARMEFLKELGAIHQAIPGDEWVLGQMVLYVGEEGRWDAAESLARRCRAVTQWWCDSLLGMSLHHQRRYPEAETAFRQALAAMPEKQAREWQDPRVVLDGSGDGKAGDWKDPVRDSLNAWVWHLSDPLYAVPGNDRWTEQMSRFTEVLVREEAEHPFGILWGFDLEELLLRFGGSISWERQRRVQTSMNLNAQQDMVGRGKAHARQFVPPGDVVDDPTGIPWGAWPVLEVNSPHTTYAPDYSPMFRPLEFQVARFRRGDSLRVVVGFEPGEGTARVASVADAGGAGEDFDPFSTLREDPPPQEEARPQYPQQPRRGGNPNNWNDPFRRVDPREEAAYRDPGPTIEPPPGPFAETYLFLSEGPDGAMFDFKGESESGRGTFDVMVENGNYVASIEVVDLAEARSWRGRQGASQVDLVPGLTAISDVLLIEDVENLPETLESAAPHAMKGHTIPLGGSLIAGWEVYGLRPGEGMSVNVVVNEKDGDFFQAIGELLRLSEPEEPVTLTWEEGGVDGMQAFFRSVRLSLPNLPAGEYVLSIEVVTPGRTAMVSSTPLIVTP